MKFIIVIMGCLLLAACNDSIEKTESICKQAIIKEATVSGALKDSNAIKFGKFTLVTDKYACFSATVPDKNAYHLTGDFQVYLMKLDVNWKILSEDKRSHEDCIDSMKYLSTGDSARKDGSSKAKAKKAVLKALKDPDSAKFGEFTEFGARACYSVNARNSYGGYAGELQAILDNSNNEWSVIKITELSHEDCIKLIRN